MGFNLSFSLDEVDVASELFDEIIAWLQAGLLRRRVIKVFEIEDIDKALMFHPSRLAKELFLIFVLG